MNLDLLLGSHLAPRLSDVLFFVEDVLDVRQQPLARRGDLAGLARGALAAARLLVHCTMHRRTSRGLICGGVTTEINLTKQV